MDQDHLKRTAAEAALEYIVPDALLGVGTGSTTNIFIDLVVRSMADRIEGAVSSSNASSDRLRAHGIRVFDLSEVDDPIPVYVDGADEFDPMLNLIKGGGGALTREKIVAQASRQFICIVDGSKRVDKLGRFPLPVEVIPMAVELVKRKLEDMGGRPRVRPNVITDNGNMILDVRGLSFDDPTALEAELDSFPGVVTCGVFSRRRADVVLMGTPEGVLRYRWQE